MENILAAATCTSMSLSFYDIASGERIKFLEHLAEEPHELVHDKKRNLLYLSHTYRDGMYGMYSSYAKEISIFDVASMSLLDVIDVSPAEAPHDFALDASRDLLWTSVERISDKVGGGLIAIDLKTRKTVRSVETQFTTHWFVMTPDGKKAYTCNKSAPFISVLDLDQGIMTGKIEVAGTEQCAISNDGKYVYFPTPALKFGQLPSDPAVQIIDTATDQIIKTVPTGQGFGPAAVYVTPSNVVMVAQYCFDLKAGKPTPINGRVSFFQGPLMETKLADQPAGRMPITMRATADGSTAFLSNVQGGDVMQFDLKTFELQRKFDVDVVASAANKHMATAHGLCLLKA